MDINLVKELISSVGFPIFVAVYMLVKSSKEIKQLTEMVEKLSVVIEKLSERCS